MNVKLLIYNSTTKDGELEKQIPPEIEIVTIGRHPSSYIYLNSAHISKEHALILHEYDTFFLVDKSTNGTLLNQNRVEREKRNRLKDGDVITVGEFRISFTVDQELPRAHAVAAALPDIAVPSQSAPHPSPQITQSSYDLYDQDPISESNYGDGTSPLSPTSFEDVIRNLEPGEESSYLIYVSGEKDGQRVELRGSMSEIYIGREPNCHVHINHPSIASAHAKIRMDWAGITIYDLNSQGGVFINGVRINSSRKLHNGDEISFGISVNAGGVKLILYDRNSISGDNWVGLPPPIKIENDDKAAEEAIEHRSAISESAEAESERSVSATPEQAASLEELPPAEPKEPFSVKSVLNLNYQIFASVTIREALILLVLLIFFLGFSAVALSFLGF